MQNINLFVLGGQCTVILFSASPTPLSAIIGKLAFIGIGNHQYRPSA
jgi:hypothetical protein